MSVPMKPTEAWAVVLPDGDLASLELSNNQTSARADTLRYDDARVARVLITEGWRPIAEAPKDGTKILVYVAYIDEPLITSGRFYPDGQFRKYEKDYPILPLTHFMPLPAPPTEVKRG